MSVRVEVEGLTRRHRRDRPPALDGVSLEVAPGALTAVVGPSGSGKSTLLGIIAGLDAPDAGDVRFDGSGVLGIPAADRGATLVLQRPYLFPHMSVGDNVTFALAARGVPRATRRAEADRWLAAVALDGMAARRPGELSGGEQQRVALARALAAEPRVLLLDEPLASLDPGVRGTLQRMLRDLVVATGVTALMVTHDLPEAVALGDRMALLDAGRLIAEGTTREVYLRPPNRRAAEFVGVAAVIDGTVRDGVLHTAAGPFRLDGHPPDGVSAAAIRPEHVLLSAPDGADAMPGEVVSCVFRGEHWDLEVRTGCGIVRARAGGPRAAGEAVGVVLPARHLFVVAP